MELKSKIDLFQHNLDHMLDKIDNCSYASEKYERSRKMFNFVFDGKNINIIHQVDSFRQGLHDTLSKFSQSPSMWERKIAEEYLPIFQRILENKQNEIL